MKRKFLKSAMFRVCVYPSKDDVGYYVAHCLELDVVGVDTTVEGSLDEVLEAIETQVSLGNELGIEVGFLAPEDVWKKYRSARKAGREIPDELFDRVITHANRRLGHADSILQDIVGTQEVLAACLAQS